MSKTNKANKNNLLNLKGVSTNNAGNYFARVTVNGKSVAVGTYDTPEKASAAYQGASKLAEKLNLKGE